MMCQFVIEVNRAFDETPCSVLFNTAAVPGGTVSGDFVVTQVSLDEDIPMPLGMQMKRRKKKKHPHHHKKKSVGFTVL
jgi:hypothetical protein